MLLWFAELWGGPRATKRILDFCTRMRTQREGKRITSHLRSRDMKEEGEQRDQNHEAAAGGREKKGARRTRPLPKYPSRLLR